MSSPENPLFLERGVITNLFYITTPTGRYPLPATFKPAALSMTAAGATLERARGYTIVYNLADGLPDPAAYTLSGPVFYDTEEELGLFLSELRAAIYAGTLFDREERDPRPLLAGGSVLSQPLNNHSGHAQIIVTLLLGTVPAPNSTTPFW